MGQSSSIQIIQSFDSEEQIINHFSSQKGIDFTSCDQEGKNALHWAASSGKSLVCQHLIDQSRLDVNAVDQYGSTALHSAVYNNCLKAARVLLDRGANIDAQDNTGMTPLHWAVKNTSRECTLLLLSYNADKSLKNIRDETVLSMTNSIKKKSIRSDFIDLLSKSPDKMMISYELESYLGSSYTMKNLNLVGLCKLWGLIKYTHPYISYRNIDWDNALIETIPKISDPSISNANLVEAIVSMISKIKDFNTRVVYNQRPIHLSYFNKTTEIDDVNNGNEVKQEDIEENEDIVMESQPQIESLRNQIAFVSFTDQQQFESLSKLKTFISLFETIRSDSKGVVFDVRQRKPYFGKGIHNLGAMFQEAFRVFLKEPLILPTIRQRVSNGLPEHQKAHPSITSIFSQGFLTLDADAIYPLASPSEKEIPLCSFIVDKYTPQNIVDIAISLQTFNKGFIVYVVDEYDYQQIGHGPASMAVLEPWISTTLFSFPTKNLDLKIHIRQNERVNPDSTIGFRTDAVIPKNRISQENNPKEMALRLCLGEEMKSPKTLVHHLYAVRKYDEDISPEELPSPELRIFSLFRLWNAVNYFFPYKDLMDNTWEYELLNFIPLFEKSNSFLNYAKSIAELVSKLSDTHAYVRSSYLSTYIGTHVPPIKVKHLNNQTVITHILDSDEESVRQLSVGDVIKFIDGVPIEKKREELTRLFSSSTSQASSWRTDMKVLAGPENSIAKIEIEKVVSRRVHKDSTSHGHNDQDNVIQVVVNIKRKTSSIVQTPRNDLSTFTILSSIDYKGNKISYVDLTRLYVHEVDIALESILLENTTSLIIDLRGYTRGTIYRLAPKLSSRNINIASTEMPLLMPSLLSDDQNYQSSIVRSYQSSSFSRNTNEIGSMSNRRTPLRIVALINEETISHGEYSIAYLKCIKPDTILIGKPTNGAVGNVTNISLPGGIIVGFSGMGISQSNGKQIQRSGIQPDVHVEETLDGIRDGVDEILEESLKFLSKNP